jgi:hypothetical protein
VTQEQAPAARKVTMSIRVSEAEAAEIDAARGPADRGTWLRDVALKAARPAPRKNPKACRHEGMRLVKGVCPDCHQYAVKK